MLNLCKNSDIKFCDSISYLLLVSDYFSNFSYIVLEDGTLPC